MFLDQLVAPVHVSHCFLCGLRAGRQWTRPVFVHNLAGGHGLPALTHFSFLRFPRGGCSPVRSLFFGQFFSEPVPLGLAPRNGSGKPQLVFLAVGAPSKSCEL